MDQSKIGRFIASKRKELGLTQVQLAEKLGVSDKSVSKWERGICLPDASLYQDLCRVLVISINELFAGEELDKAEVETRSEETILSIAQEGSNKEMKLRTKIIALVIVVCLLAVGFIYAYSKMEKEEAIPTNYIRSYTYTEDGETIKNIMQGSDGNFGLVQFDVDDTYKKATLVIDKYRGSELVSSRDSIALDELHGGGLISAEFNPFDDGYELKIANSDSQSVISDASITDIENYNIEEFASSMQMIGDVAIEIKKGEAIPLFVFYISADGSTCSYEPDKVEELAKEGQLNIDYTMVVKVIFE